MTLQKHNVLYRYVIFGVPTGIEKDFEITEITGKEIIGICLAKVL